MIDNFSLILFSVCIALTVFRAIRLERAARTDDRKKA
jgi:hypothetical protein